MSKSNEYDVKAPSSNTAVPAVLVASYMHSAEEVRAIPPGKAARSEEESLSLAAGMRIREMLEHVGDGVITTDRHGEIMYMNRMAETLTGFSRQEGVGWPLQQIFRVVDSTTRQARADLAQKAIETDAVVPLANGAVLIARDEQEVVIEDSAAPVHDAHGTVTGAMIVFHDSRYSSESIARMAELARHDPLTGLLNRYAFEERFEQSLTLARRHNKRMGLLFIDLDHFKEINDARGHDGGDAILKALAEKFLSCMRHADAACRYGGDEFVVLLSEVEQPDHVFAVADKVRGIAGELSLADGQEVVLDISIGASIYPENGETLELLLQQADAAMYRNKAWKKWSKPHAAFSSEPSINLADRLRALRTRRRAAVNNHPGNGSAKLG